MTKLDLTRGPVRQPITRARILGSQASTRISQGSDLPRDVAANRSYSIHYAGSCRAVKGSHSLCRGLALLPGFIPDSNWHLATTLSWFYNFFFVLFFFFSSQQTMIRCTRCTVQACHAVTKPKNGTWILVIKLGFMVFGLFVAIEVVLNRWLIKIDTQRKMKASFGQSSQCVARYHLGLAHMGR